MPNSLYIGAAGMVAQQLSIDTIANNIANINTPGYKKARVSFRDVYYGGLERAGLSPQSDVQAYAGMGTVAIPLGKAFDQGQLKKTDASSDLAISGDGFVEVVLPDGSSGYVRSPVLQANRDGMLATSDGYVLHQQIAVPSEASALQIDATGRVSASLAGESTATELGQIELVRFINPSGLTPLGENLYGASDKAGDPLRGKPGDEGFGTLLQGYSEGSNVQLNDEMINMTITQHIFNLCAKVFQAGDDMESTVNSLFR
ncbi:flagellar hook-basal body protein [Noviherbaspirillum pedocola]|uniref:Flagellar basal body rod protein FlgG n=1 Tax=Noviherbaspirillum pedocola TaxID=2801341 RepID=A0A934SZP6_9BURK|nr:flagellar hook-basal body complex protein [Noviherbaspirillum pedocola]MBK4735689.1 flagellar basal body rod protein FlgG [Noviherbaspirillum pedocola]